MKRAIRIEENGAKADICPSVESNLKVNNMKQRCKEEFGSLGHGVLFDVNSFTSLISPARSLNCGLEINNPCIIHLRAGHESITADLPGLYIMNISHRMQSHKITYPSSP